MSVPEHLTIMMRVVVTAGPTREHLDPVRFLSNPSTGKMGFAIAAEAARRGHEVVLIAGPVALKTPKGVKRVDVVSAEWDKLDNGSRLITSVLVARKAFADEHPAAVRTFLSEYAASTDYANANPAEAAVLVEKYGIVKAAVAEIVLLL